MEYASYGSQSNRVYWCNSAHGAKWVLGGRPGCWDGLGFACCRYGSSKFQDRAHLQCQVSTQDLIINCH